MTDDLIRIETHARDAHTQGKGHVRTEPTRPSTSQGERPQETLKLLIPSSLISSLQSCEKSISIV